MKTCNETRIARFLNGELPAGEVTSLEAHLEICDRCRCSLDGETAQASWWQEASEYLSDDEIDCELLSTFIGQSPQDANDAAERRRSKAETDATVRQFLKHLDATDDPHMLGRFGGYEIAGVIGAGGMSFVLKGFDAALSRYVAIKVLSPHLATSDAARQRFAREAQAAAAVVHDNVIAIHSVNGDGDLPYLVMPYERGSSLQRRLDERGALALTELLRIGFQVAQGLSAAHDQGLVHRDIKPGNILLTNNVERVKLTDFGLARAVDDASLTRTGMIAGTPQYMSPEQAQGEAIDQRSDLFSLGSVLYTMATGRPPFVGESSYSVLVKIANSKPTPIQRLNPSMPAWLCRIVERLHAQDPNDRYSNAKDVAADLRQCLAHVQRPSDTTVPTWLHVKDAGINVSHKMAMIVLTVALIAVGIAIGKVALGPWSQDKAESPNSVQTSVQQPKLDGEGQGRGTADSIPEIDAELHQIEQDVTDLEQQMSWFDE